MLLVIRLSTYDNTLHNTNYSQNELGTAPYVGSLSLFGLRFSYVFPHESDGIF